jgi:predicted unusual protein kinase regulating ubiquinone biosynthesis (AarF/ABC1/UbiB family)
MPDDSPPERSRARDGLPSSRAERTARFGGLVAGQGLRWAGTRAANLLRSEERAEAATGDRAAALARELVDQLGQMRGAAMKLGQVLSTIDFAALPESEREHFKETLAALRDDVPPVPFKRIRSLLEEELGGPLRESFAEFDEEAFAAASIGQVHRAVTHDGQEVAVKVQYPGVAEAVETDLRNMQMLLPLVKRLAPGLDARALADELRERVSEELDYELEAQNQRAVARAWRGHPFVFVPPVLTALSSRRVLVTELLHGRRFEEVKRLPDADRDRFGEIVFRFFFGTLMHLRRVSGDPHPGNYLLLDDGRIGFLDFGLMRVVDAAYLDGERALALAVSHGDAQEVFARLAALGYLPRPEEFDPERLLAQMRLTGEWYFVPGHRRLTPQYVAHIVEVGSSPRSPFYEEMRKEDLPPQALLIRRMEGLIFSTLGELRAAADWNALAHEYFAAGEPSTPLGEEDAEFWSRSPLARRPAA